MWLLKSGPVELNEALMVIERWPVGSAAAGVTGPGGVLGLRGPVDQVYPLASVTKLISAYAVLVAVEEGTLALGDPAGPDGSTVAHLLGHASGLGFDGGVVARPGRRRIYSNAGFDVLGEVLAARAGMPFTAYATEAVLIPLRMTASRISGSPAWGARSSVTDLVAFGRELLAPTLVSPATLHRARTVAFPGLSGVLPGFGRQDPNDWGLGLEIRDRKSPHWTGSANSPATFGHFGRSGTFLWVDPAAGLACVALTDRDFGSWAAEAWPAFSDGVLAAVR